MPKYFTLDLNIVTLFTRFKFTTIFILIMLQTPSICSRNALCGLLKTSTGYPVIMLTPAYFQKSLDLSKLSNLALYFTLILGFGTFRGESPDFNLC